jgi:hypothetical protein
MSIKRAHFGYAINKAINGAIVNYVSNNKLSQEQMDELVDEAWQRLKVESPHALQRERFAVVLDDATSLEQVQYYLPQGYTAKIEHLPGNQAGKTSNAMRVVIRGYDIAGWTLDDYVIPRLASGLIVATEVFEAKEFDHDED